MGCVHEYFLRFPKIYPIRMSTLQRGEVGVEGHKQLGSQRRVLRLLKPQPLSFLLNAHRDALVVRVRHYIGIISFYLPDRFP